MKSNCCKAPVTKEWSGFDQVRFSHYLCNACHKRCELDTKKYRADDMVTMIKKHDREIQDTLRDFELDDIDFTGCSPDYVREKIFAAVNYLTFLARHIREWEKTKKHAGANSENRKATNIA